jgi:hypothetical protein
VSITARIVRQFEAPHELVTLEKVIELPPMPTMGTRLDLRSEGVEAPLEVVGVTLRPEADGPPEADIFLAYEPLAAAQLARFGGWRTSESGSRLMPRFARAALRCRLDVVTDRNRSAPIGPMRER